MDWNLFNCDVVFRTLGFRVTVELLLRLFIAGFCGILIGLERELRAKEAGVRTHFLVCTGSALFMMVSTFGFLVSPLPPEMKEIADFRGADAARIAAQIVSGIGFIGAGTIMVTRGNITGLTTAAGLWVVAGIGMAVGGGLYLVALVSTVLVLIGMEMLRIFVHKARLTYTLIYKTTDRQTIFDLEDALRKKSWRILSHDIAVKGKRNTDAFRVTLVLQQHATLDDGSLVAFLKRFPDITLEKIDSSR